MSEKFKTIVSKLFDDGSIQYYYADVELKDGVATFNVDANYPLSDDEIAEFNRNKNPTK